MTTVFDAAGKGSAKACWVLMRRARADRFESASAAAKPSPFQGVVFRKTKKPDMYWSAPRAAERPVISVAEIGYVRRSEITPMANFPSELGVSSSVVLFVQMMFADQVYRTPLRSFFTEH
jgi:hypothetical protein